MIYVVSTAYYVSISTQEVQTSQASCPCFSFPYTFENSFIGILWLFPLEKSLPSPVGKIIPKGLLPSSNTKGSRYLLISFFLLGLGKADFLLLPLWILNQVGEQEVFLCGEETDQWPPHILTVRNIQILNRATWTPVPVHGKKKERQISKLLK